MRATIWCMRGYGDDASVKAEALQVWDGNLEQIPSVGDNITVFKDWGMATVRTVCYNIEEGYVEIGIDPDWSGEYKEELNRRGY